MEELNGRVHNKLSEGRGIGLLIDIDNAVSVERFMIHNCL